MDYFALFSLPRHLQLDVSGLERTFYAQSRRLHPDRFAGRPAAEQADALERSSELNDDYRTLRDPIARTEYLLSLEGVQLEEQSRQATDAARASGEAKKQVAPPDLLEEAFELNMQLEEMRFARGTGEIDAVAQRDLEAARTRFTGLLTETQARLEELWAKWDRSEAHGDTTEKADVRDAMVSVLNRRSYLRNLVRDVNAVLE